jgi:hypothetical protein
MGILAVSLRGIMTMGRLLALALACLLAHQTQAADISLISAETTEHPALILIKGRLSKERVNDDTNTFHHAVASITNAIVFLNSPGGSLETAISIGQSIRRRDFSTAVTDNAKCASACALIWIAGKDRYMGDNTRVGFHATTKSEGNDISPGGNAIVGAYLYQLGITYFPTIAHLTSAPPNSMTWLDANDAFRYGIPVKLFSFYKTKWLLDASQLDAQTDSQRGPSK